MSRTGQLGQASRSHGTLGASEQRLNGFMRNQINLFVSGPSIYSQIDQFFILPGGASEDRFLQRVEGQTQLGGPAPFVSRLAAPGCLHRIFAESTARANSG